MKSILMTLFLAISGYITHAQSITITEINYKSDSTHDGKDWLELHNYGTTTIDISRWHLIDTAGNPVAYRFNYGTLIAPNAYLVVCKDLGLFAAYHPGVTNAVGNFTFKIKSVDRIILSDSNNVLKVTAQCSNTKGWPKGANGEGRTLELISQNSNANLTDSFAWRDGCMLGSAGKAPVLCNDPIIFSEINYNSDSTADQGEFLELHNTTATPINLTNYFVRDGVDSALHIYKFASGTILPANGYLVLSNDTASFKKYWPNVTNILGNFTFSFSNGGELIRLYNANAALQFSIHYNDTLPWPDSADGYKYTLELKDKDLNMEDGSNWKIGCKMGSPGKAFTMPCVPVWPVGIINTQPSQFEITPNPTFNFFKININTTAALNIYDAVGKLLLKTKVSDGQIIDMSMFRNGIYFAAIIDETGTSNIKKIVKQ
jgi:Lamin Tail Domain/Secretion system C-terminal sorting domain